MATYILTVWGPVPPTDGKYIISKWPLFDQFSLCCFRWSAFFIRKHSPYMFINGKKILKILIFLRTYWLTLFRLMEFSIKLHTIKSGWPIVYFLLWIKNMFHSEDRFCISKQCRPWWSFTLCGISSVCNSIRLGVSGPQRTTYWSRFMAYPLQW